MNRRIISALIVFLLLASVVVPAVSAHTLSELHSAGVAHPTVDLGDIPVLTWGVGYEYGYTCKDDVWRLWCFSTEEKIIDFTEERNRDNETLIDYVYDFARTLQDCSQKFAGNKALGMSGVVAGGAGVTIGLSGAIPSGGASTALAVTGAGAVLECTSSLLECNSLCDEAVNLFRRI